MIFSFKFRNFNFQSDLFIIFNFNYINFILIVFNSNSSSDKFQLNSYDFILKGQQCSA